jgi:hypothetical protein
VRIARGDLDLIKPRMLVQALGVARKNANAIAVGEKLSNESTTDVTGSSGNKAQCRLTLGVFQ